MDYNLGFILAFKCIFCYDFISIFVINTQYMIDDGKKIWIEKNYNRNFNQQITMDFLMTRFGLSFKSPNLGHFFWIDIFFPPNTYNKEFSRWASFHMDFIN